MAMSWHASTRRNQMSEGQQDVPRINNLALGVTGWNHPQRLRFPLALRSFPSFTATLMLRDGTRLDTALSVLVPCRIRSSPAYSVACILPTAPLPRRPGPGSHASNVGCHAQGGRPKSLRDYDWWHGRYPPSATRGCDAEILVSTFGVGVFSRLNNAGISYPFQSTPKFQNCDLLARLEAADHLDGERDLRYYQCHGG